MLPGGGPDIVTESAGDAQRAEDRAFVERFEQGALEAAEWNHEGHLRVAFGLVRRYGPLEGLIRMRAGIFALNAAHGTSNTATSGYHETLTVAWFTLVAAAVRDTSALDFEQLIERRPELLLEATVLAHYSAERIATVEARARYVRPDRTILPAL